MKIVDFIRKDTAVENQSYKIILALRVLSIIVFIAFIIDIILAGLDAIEAFPFRIFFLFSANIIVFASTYYLKTKSSVILFILYIFAWSILMMQVFGWSAGMQNYYIIVLMLLFFASYRRARAKFILAGSVLVFRILTIVIFGGIKSNVVESGSIIDKCIQTANISAVFLAIIFLSYLFSHEKNEAEGKLMQYNDKLKKEANTDPLTGLFNRRKADEYLKQIIKSSEIESVSIAIGDIDFFKKVNDTYGHDIGDEVLKFISEEMAKNSRDDTFLARWGGEEFLIVLPNCNGDDAYVAVERVRNAIQNSEIKINDDITIKVTMTFGVAELSFRKGVDFTVKEADEKLYMGKQSGRNKVVY